MPRGGVRPGAGKKAKVTNQVYLDQYEEVWAPHLSELLKAKLIDALGYDPGQPIDPKKNPKRPANLKERNDILDRLVGPAFANHQPVESGTTQITFLDILIQNSKAPEEIAAPTAVITGEVVKKVSRLEAKNEEPETIEGTDIKLIG